MLTATCISSLMRLARVSEVEGGGGYSQEATGVEGASENWQETDRSKIVAKLPQKDLIQPHSILLN